MPEIERITSRDNGRLIAARKVRDGKDRTRVLIEGRRLVDEALSSDLDVEECFLSESMLDDRITRTLPAVPTFALSEKLLSSIADTQSPQGIVLIAKRPATGMGAIEKRFAEGGRLRLVVFLEEISNPSNLGAVLRTAEAAGVMGVITSPGSSDAFAPKALRGAMGATFRIPIAQGIDIKQAVAWAELHGFEPTAADTRSSTLHADVDWKKPRLLVLGSEAHGLSDDQLRSITTRVCISMASPVESLNLAVSAGILLFEAKRQNDLSG